MIQVPTNFIKSSLEILRNKYLYLTTDTHFSFNLNMKICMLQFFFSICFLNMLTISLSNSLAFHQLRINCPLLSSFFLKVFLSRLLINCFAKYFSYTIQVWNKYMNLSTNSTGCKHSKLFLIHSFYFCCIFNLKN